MYDNQGNLLGYYDRIDYWFKGWIDDPMFVINRVDSDTYAYSADPVVNIVYSNVDTSDDSDNYLYLQFKPHE